jgi:hypothetical protein
MGTGTETTGREVYLYNTVTGTLTRVTTTTGYESYAPSRVTDATFTAGRPVGFSFVSTGDLDPDGDNSDHNPEIFTYEIISGEIHQLTDTQPPVVNSAPFASDSFKCVVFESTGDLDDNDGSNDGDPGAGFTNADGSQEVFRYNVVDPLQFPHDGYFTQMSSGPVGTSSWSPTTGGYIWARQCGSSPYVSNHPQIGDPFPNTLNNIFIYDQSSGDILPMTTGETPRDGGPSPAGNYGTPFISAASNFARGPYVTFSTDTDVWNNGLTGYESFRFRVFHPRMTQYTHVEPGDVFEPQISDGGGYLVYSSTAEMLDLKHGAKHVGPGPFNADGSSEIFQSKGRSKAWQITRGEGCDSFAPSIQDTGAGIAFISTCDLVPGNNPSGLPQVFYFYRVKTDDPILAPGACQILDGCCNETNS